MSERQAKARRAAVAANGNGATHDTEPDMPDDAQPIELSPEMVSQMMGAGQPPSEGDQRVTQPGVIIWREPVGNGQEQIRIAPINGLDPLSVPSILRMAARIHEQQLGII